MVPGSSSSSGKKENYWRIDPSLGGEGGGGMESRALLAATKTHSSTIVAAIPAKK